MPPPQFPSFKRCRTASLPPFSPRIRPAIFGDGAAAAAQLDVEPLALGIVAHGHALGLPGVALPLIPVPRSVTATPLPGLAAAD
jgi:hypothetical protein